MKKAVLAFLIGISILACPILYFAVGPSLDGVQLETLRLLVLVAGGSGLFCFAVGEATKNNSQMDKLWSLLPEIYLWIIAIKGGMKPRLVLMAVLATLWGIRLTYNFARKGAYRLKFWEGEEDYRWSVLRGKKEFQPHYKWVIFNLLFISIYQNALVLMTTLPALVSMNSSAPLGVMDGVAALLMAGAIVYELIADEQQWAFHSKKKELLKGGKALSELPMPYRLGFNTVGLWNRSRHPNYLAEQSVWISLYLFSIGAGIGIFNWSLIGALLLVVLFLGSSALAEEISRSKYPKYEEYCGRVHKFFPVRKYRQDTETDSEAEALAEGLQRS